ncbi:MAG: hypothetical protein ABSF98_22460 [Bryobacteraceae bacterium]|jgi:hypothetical protein
MMKNRVVFMAFAVVLFLGVTVAQEVLDDRAVMEMAAAGLPDEIIIAKIRSSKTDFDLSTPALARLTQAKVSSAVMKAMIELKPSAAAPAAGPAPAAAPTAGLAPAAADINDPMAPHDPGVYLAVVDRDGVKTMTLLERAGAGHEKTANIWGHAFSYGISKAKVKAELPGQRATTRSPIARPEFYMYFPPTGSLGAADTISSPSQFTLISLEVKKDHRETAVLKVGFANASSGTDEKRTFKFNAEKIRPYAYKITPDASLKSGEYAFIAGTAMAGTASSGSAVIFDFGVDTM